MQPIAAVAFDAFATASQYGVRIGTGDVDGDVIDDMLCGRGAGITQACELRGFQHDGAGVAWLPGFDVTPFPSSYGASGAGGDVDGQRRDDLLAGAGPAPTADTTIRSYAYDGAALVPLPPIVAFPGSAFGVNVGAGCFDH